MGYMHATIELSNPRDPELQPISAHALADFGALMLCIPQHLALQLKLTINASRQRLEPDPRSPNIPHALVKDVRPNTRS